MADLSRVRSGGSKAVSQEAPKGRTNSCCSRFCEPALNCLAVGEEAFVSDENLVPSSVRNDQRQKFSANRCASHAETRFGGGAGYRIDVSGIFQEQFETDTGAMTTSQKVEGQVAAIWGQIIIEPLKEASAFSDEE